MYSKEKTENIIALLSFVTVFVWLIWRVKYGFANEDETFYIANAYRFLQGDHFYIDDWFLGQSSSFLLLPILKIYLLINDGCMDGIMLNFRYIFCIFQFFSAIYIYIKLKKMGTYVGALLASLIYFVYAPQCISALCYNTLGISFYLITLVNFTLLDFKNYKKVMFVGITYGISVLCCPSLFFIYILCTVFMFVKYLLGREYQMIEAWVYFTIGGAIIAILFLGYIFFNGVRVYDFCNNISYLLNYHHTVNNKSIFNVITFYLDFLYNNIFLARGTPINNILIILTSIALFIDKKKNRYYIYYILLAVEFTVFISTYRLLTINYVMYPLNILGLIIYIANKDLKDSNIFFRFWMPGMLYTFLISMVSITGVFSLTSAAIVPLMGSIVIICNNIHNLYKQQAMRNKWCILLVIPILLTFCLEVEMRQKQIYWGGDIEEQKIFVDKGIEKGLYVRDDDYYFDYIENMDNVLFFDKSEFHSIAYVTSNPYMYLMTPNMRNKFFMAYILLDRMDFNYYKKTLESYYSDDNRRPDVVYIDNNAEEDYSKWFIDRFKYKNELNTPSGAKIIY